MKPNLSLKALLAIGLISTAAGDTIRMKDGTVYEGKVLKDDVTGGTYTVEIQVTKSIKDEKVLKRADVEKIEREQEDVKAFAGLDKLVPVPDLLTADDYDNRLVKVYDFLKGNGKSTLAPKAKEIAAQLEKERDAVSAGGVKLAGRIIPAEERQANAFEIDARLIEAAMRTYAANAQPALALRKFAELEKDFVSSQTFREALPVARQLITRFRAETAEALSGFDARVKERQVGLDRMTPDDRQNTQRALAEQDATEKAQYDAEKKAAVKWITPRPFIKASLDDTVRFSDSELKRLETLKVDSLPDGGKAFRDAWTAVHGDDAKAASTALSALSSARLPKSYIDRLEEIAKASGLKK